MPEEVPLLEVGLRRKEMGTVGNLRAGEVARA